MGGSVEGAPPQRFVVFNALKLKDKGIVQHHTIGLARSRKKGCVESGRF